jgi:hypothetical protein
MSPQRNGPRKSRKTPRVHVDKHAAKAKRAQEDNEQLLEQLRKKQQLKEPLPMLDDPQNETTKEGTS